MAKRITITKSTRFEVFKRDKFTCQYCGRKAPDVVLNVDHIEPVSKGGGNEIINLVTSCFDCNNGKRDKKLDDNSVVEKQRKQLELLQERREQMELMIEWKKSLSSLADDTTNLILDYVNSKIPSFSVNESGRKAIEKWIKDFSINDILDSIDQAAIKYLKYNEGKLTPESVQEYFNKIAGITAVKNMPLLKQKLAYIKGICRNRFNYWDAKKGTSILTDYVKALEDYGWNENQIIHDLETEVMEKTKSAANWSEWRDILEGWTEDIKKWDKQQPEPKYEDMPSRHNKIEIADEDIEIDAERNISFAKDKIEVLIYLAKAFPDFTDEMINSLKNDMYLIIGNHLNKIESQYKDKGTYLETKLIDSIIDQSASLHSIEDKYYKLLDDYAVNYGPLNWGSFCYINNERLIEHITKDILLEHSYPMMNYDYKSILKWLQYLKNYYSALCMTNV